MIENISELNIQGYYDESNGWLTVWFHNYNNTKSDIVAYLKSDMSWDIRRIVSETSRVFDDHEEVFIKHNRLTTETPGSEFDKIVRAALAKQIETISESGQELQNSTIKMQNILKNNKYPSIIEGN